jgi:hypothetical protein
MQLSTAVLIVLLFAVIVVVIRRKRQRASDPPRPPRRIGSIGPGAAGTIYELLNEEKRNAIEIIVEDKAAYTEAEHADGNLPDLENPDQRKP